MLALYVYSYLLLGRKLPRGHAVPSERCRDERRVDTVLVFTLDGRYLATYAAEGSEGTVVWKGRRIAASDLFLSTHGLVAGRQVVGNAELNPPSEPEYIHQANTYTTRRWPA